jgi:hypothetical protein
MSIVSDLDLPTCYFAVPDGIAGRYHHQLAEARQPVLRR